MKYQVIHRPTVEALEATVQRFLHEGWHCQGGLAIDSVNGVYFQALVQPPGYHVNPYDNEHSLEHATQGVY